VRQLRIATLIIGPALAFSVIAPAQTTTTYNASTGSISGTATATLRLDLGGNAVVAPGVSGCQLLPQNCAFQTGYVSYTLPPSDGSSADLTNYSGVMEYVSGVTNNVVYHVHGIASGPDSTGTAVSVAAEFTMRAQCKPVGRTTSCTKTYLGGSITVTK